MKSTITAPTSPIGLRHFAGGQDERRRCGTASQAAVARGHSTTILGSSTP